MKNIALIIFVQLIFIVSTVDSRAADIFPLKVESIAPGVTQVSNVANVGYVTLDAHFTPDGKYLIVAASGEFCVIPVAKLDEGIENLDKARAWKGDPSGYLPSGKIVFSKLEGLYAFDPVTEKIRAIYELPKSEIDPERPYLSMRLTVLSDDLIISGDGDSGDGSLEGNVLRFDVNRGRRTRGAAVPAFYNPQLSPSRRFILYEHGNGLNKSYAELYDVARDARYTLATRFNLKRAFPKYKKIIERPVAWTSADTFLGEVEKVDSEREISDATYISEDAWLVLFNAATGRIVWKRNPKIEFGGSTYHQLSATKMLVDTGEGKLYELSLIDGKANQLPNLEGSHFTPSPDKKKLIYVHSNQVFVAALDGSEKKKILDLPQNWTRDRWGPQYLRWSPDGKRVIVIRENQFLFVRL